MSGGTCHCSGRRKACVLVRRQRIPVARKIAERGSRKPSTNIEGEVK